MKKILALALFAVALVSCRQTMQTDGFKLSGHLEGLQVGDTLFLKTFLLPDWKEDGTDTILVEKEGIFSAFIPMEHTTFYLLTHQPKVGEPLRSCIRGAEIIARVGDDIKLEGSLDYLGAVRHSGGFYDNSLVARYDSLTASSNTEMIDIFSQILKYQDTKQNDSVAKYGQMYNEYHRPLMLKTVRDSLALKVNDMEYAAFMYASAFVFDATYKDVKERLAQFTPEVQNSYFEMITDDEHLMDVWGMVHWNMNDLYNMTAGQYKAYWLKKYEETKSAICSDKKRSQAYRELLLAQNDLLCTLTLTRVSSNLAYAYVQCSGLPAREAYQKFKQPELSDDFYDYIRQLNILNSPVMLYANGYADLVRGMGYLRVKMDDELSDIFAFILSSDKVSAEDAKIIREFKADTDTGKTSVYQEKMGELRIKYDELFKEFSSMQQDYILKKIIAGYLGTDQGLFFDLQKMMKYAQKISDFTPLTVHDFEEIRKMSDPYYLGRLTKMNNRLLETIEANKKKKGYTVNESGEVKDEDLFYSIISKFKGKVVLVDFWATWCGPCKMAMKQMKPMKKDLEGKDIVYVFIAGENSPKETWDNIIPDIHGEHYRVTAAQWKYLSKQFSIQGVPTYIIVDKEGAVIQKHTGFPGVDTVKKELMKALEK